MSGIVLCYKCQGQITMDHCFTLDEGADGKPLVRHVDCKAPTEPSVIKESKTIILTSSNK